DPANAGSVQLQLDAVTRFSQQLGEVSAPEPKLLAQVQDALQASGEPDVSVTPDDVRAAQAQAASAGLPEPLVQVLRQLDSSDAQVSDAQTRFASQDAARAAGSLAMTLTDPTFAAQVSAFVGMLPDIVLLTGALSPASDSGVSHDDGITNVTTPTFRGTAPPGTTVQVFAQRQIDATPIPVGQGVADAAGNWEVAVGHLDDGSYAMSVRFTGASS